MSGRGLGFLLFLDVTTFCFSPAPEYVCAHNVHSTPEKSGGFRGPSKHKTSEEVELFQVPESNTLPIPSNLFLQDYLLVLKQKSFPKIHFYLSRELYILSDKTMPSFPQFGMQHTRSRSKPGLA